MTQARSIHDYVQDILYNIQMVHRFVGEMTFEELLADEKTAYAVTRAFEIIGEAASHLPKELLARYPSIGWRNLMGMRNWIAHGYFAVNLEIVWAAIQRDLPKLQDVAEKIMAELPEEDE